MIIINKSNISDEDFIKITENSQTMAQASILCGMAYNTFIRRAKKLGVYKPNQGGKGTKKSKRTKISTEDILEIMEKITENSMYSYQKQICSGYITLRGGHRVGISGNVVMEEDKVININYIYSLNFRIARQIIGVSEKEG